MACVIRAPSPSDPDKKIALRIDSSIIVKTSNIGYSRKIFQMYYNLCGEPPPVNNIGYHEKDSGIFDKSKGIMDTHAVFQGIKRPCIDENGDKSVYIYVTKPEYIYKYRPDMVCTVFRDKFPDGAVFATYVRFDEEEIPIEVVDWEPLKSGSDDRLPEDSESRYDQMRWIK